MCFFWHILPRSDNFPRRFFFMRRVGQRFLGGSWSSPFYNNIPIYIYTYSYAASRNHVSYLCTHVPNAAIASSTAAPHCCVVITVYIFYIHSMVVVVVASMEHSSYNISSRPWPFAVAEECVYAARVCRFSQNERMVPRNK